MYIKAILNIKSVNFIAFFLLLIISESLSGQSSLPYTPNAFQYVFVDCGGDEAGNYGHCVALRCDGTVWTWGEGSNGQLGNAASSDSDVPVQVKGLGGVGNLKNVVAVAAGANHCLALLTDSTLVAWGSDAVLQLGNGATTNGSFSNVPVVVSNLTKVIAIAAGTDHSIALRANGTVWGWGDDFSGQLGQCSFNTDSDVPLKARGPACAAGDSLTNVVMIAAGEEHNVVLRSDSTVWTWGKDSQGQLGNDNSNAKQNKPVLVIKETNDDTLKGVVAVAAGYLHSLALISDGSMYTWGDNQNGQLADGTASAKQDKAVSVLGLGNVVVAIAGGGNHTIVMLRDSTVKTWGSDALGQLGNGAANDGSFTNSPVNVTLPAKARVVAAGVDNSIVILHNDSIMDWGRDNNGELGNNNAAASKNAPVTVFGISNGYKVANAGPDKSYCSGGGPVQLGETATPGFIYSWTPTAGLDNPALSNPNHDTSVAQTAVLQHIVSVSLLGGNIKACQSTDTVIVTVFGPIIADFTSSAPRCENSIVQFYNTGTPKAGGVTFSWGFGANASFAAGQDTVEEPKVTYSSSGAKTISLTVTSALCADSDSKNDIITINDNPTVSFSSSASKCAGDTLNFNSVSNGVGDVYNWDFGKDAIPNSSTAEDPLGIQFTSSGSKTITLTVSNANCSFTGTNIITINAAPVADFSTTAPICTGDSVTFTNTGTSGSTYAWDFDIVANDAAPADASTENATGIIYSTAGNKKIKLKVTLGSCVDSVTNTITINQDPNADFSFTGGTLCGNTGVNFTNIGTTGAGWTYSWDFGLNAQPNSSTAENPTGIKYNTDGSKLVTFTISDANCSDIETKTVTIAATPNADFTNTAPACTEDIVSFTNIGTTGGTYSWTFGDGNVSTSENPTNVYATSGNKIITLITTVGSCKDTSMQTITINQKPASSFAFTGGTLCGNEGINFTNTGTTGNTWSYNWDFGKSAAPNSSVAENPTGVLYDSSGTHTVTFTVSDASCSESSTQTITISPTPVAGFTSTAPACTEDSVDFTNTGSTGVNWKYNWTFGSGASVTSSASQNPTDIIYSTEGIKTVTLVIADTAGNCSDTITKTININFKPLVGFNSTAPVCAGAGVNFVNTGSSGNQWSHEWDFGKDAEPILSSSEDPTGIKYSSGGVKTVTFSISDNNCTRTITQNITINALPNVNAGTDTIICANRSVQIGSTSVSGYSYSWYPVITLDNPTISNPVASPESDITVYYVLATENTTSCQNTDSVIVTMIPNLVADAGLDVIICKGDSVQIGSSLIEGQNYTWSPVSGINNITSPNPVVSPASTTTYLLTVSGSGCDPITDEIKVLVLPLPAANAGVDVTIAKGDETQLAATGGSNYKWTPTLALSNAAIYNPIANPDSTIIYKVEVTDIYGCINYDSVTVTVVIPIVWTPNTFTPNDDGKNDIFYIRGFAEIKDFNVAIYNRLGSLLFYSTDIKIGWDGTNSYTKEYLPSGAYVYVVKGTNNSGEPITINGLVNLIR